MTTATLAQDSTKFSALTGSCMTSAAVLKRRRRGVVTRTPPAPPSTSASALRRAAENVAGHGSDQLSEILAYSALE